MSRIILQKIIEDFNPDSFVRFFREKSRTFAPRAEELTQYNNSDFINGKKIGELHFGQNARLFICSFGVTRALIERSGKKAQYEQGKKILKENQYDAGIFIFNDATGNFRFSLIYASYLGRRRDWSSFRRFTYHVSKELTNKTFLHRIGDGDLATLEKIKEAFSVEKVTKAFYTDIAYWYFWAVQNVVFPKDAEKEENGRNIAVIRLITRLIFIWFMKERRLIRQDLFNKHKVAALLKNLSPNDTTYYKAILQNLFFATLNTKVKKRKFRYSESYHGMRHDYMDHDVYRYGDYFKNTDNMMDIFKDIPFLNGGLFDCLDRRATNNGKNIEIRIDGFTDKEVGLSVPNHLFFSDEIDVDLNREYGTKNKRYKVKGLIDILSSYNFTIDENVPDDQEVALDPELLGKVFENLLASYNPETATTARKATGSYYTPREIVDYMVTQSLKEYLKSHFPNIRNLDNKLDKLFSKTEEGNPFDIADTMSLVSLIDNIRIVDPAVGSGAFPMGILSKLVFILSKLDPHNKLWKKTQIKAVEESVPDPRIKEKIVAQIVQQFAEKDFNYGRKLYLIQKCIYGVDIQQIAVEIAKLRFFISLLVDESIDETKDNWGIEPLPNLEFKLMQGNSLTSEFMGINLDSETCKSTDEIPFKDETYELIKQFQHKKSEFQNEPDKRRKDKLREEVDNYIIKIFEKELEKQKSDYFLALRNIEERYSAISDATERDEYVTAEKKDLYEKTGLNLDKVENELHEFTCRQKVKHFFAWRLYFAEVFQEKGGFDIVIANPPYIQLQEKEKISTSQRKAYKNQHFKTYDGNGDIYCLFYEKGYELLKPNGLLCFITSNKWLRTKYGEKLRNFLLKYTNPQFLIDFSGFQVFESAMVDTSILLLSKDSWGGKLNAVHFKDDYQQGHSIEKYIAKNTVAVPLKNSSSWTIVPREIYRVIAKIRHNGVSLKMWDIAINYGIKTGANDVFIINANTRDEITQKDPRSSEVIQPVLRGIDLLRFTYKWSNKYIIFTRRGCDINSYPDVFEYLERYRQRLRPKPKKWQPDSKKKWQGRKSGSYKWYEIQDNIAYYSEFEKEKVAWMNMNRKWKFSFVPRGYYIEASLNFIASNEHAKFLTGVLSSRLHEWYFRHTGRMFDSGGYMCKVDSISAFPVPKITKNNNKIKQSIESAVDEVINIKGENSDADTTQMEKKVDQLIYQLYNLTNEEIRLVEESFK
jgi:hypothetical protein